MKWKFQVAIVFILRVNVDCFPLGSVKITCNKIVYGCLGSSHEGPGLKQKTLKEYEHKPGYFLTEKMILSDMKKWGK